jgi:thiol-disulfide isomerase/thioredoxin
MFPIDKSNQYLQEIFNEKLQESKIEAQQKDSIKTSFNPVGEFKTLTLMDFWFIGCQPCHKSFPAIEKIRQTYSESQLDVKALTLNKQEDADKYKVKFGYTFDMLYDTNQYITKFDIISYPTKILITPEGDILYRAGGSKLNVDEYQIIKEIIDAYLKAQN